MTKKNWKKIAQQEFSAMDPKEQADWMDLRTLIEKRY